MATTKANIDVSVTGQQQLDRLQTGLGKVNELFTRFRGVISGVAFAGLARSSLQLADAIDDLSQATGIAVDGIVRLQDAVTRAGGSIEGAGKGLQFFFAQVDAAAAGSAKLQATFGSIGIGLNELRNLSEQQLFIRTAEQLAQMESGARKTALQAELLGKSFRSVVIDQDFVRNLKQGDEETAKLAASISRAAKLNEEFEASWTKLRLAFLEAFGPIISGLATIAEALNKIPGLVQILSVALLAIPGALIGRSVVTGLSFITKGLFGATNAAKSATAATSGLGKALQAAGNSKIGQAIRNRATAIGAAIGIGGGAAAAVIGGRNLEDAALKDAKQQAKTQQALAQAEGKAQRDVTDALKAKRVEIQAVSAAFANQNSSVIQNIELENKLIGKSRQYSDTLRAQDELSKRGADEIQRLTDAKARMSDDERALGLGAEYDKQIAKIKELTDAEAQRLERSIANSARLQAAESLRQFGISQEVDLQKQLNTILDDTAKIGLTAIESKYQDIAAAARDSARAAIAAEAARRGLDTLPQADQEEYYRRAAAGMDRLRTATKNLHDQSRTFGAGWRKAFNEYVDAATNAAARAERIFTKFVTGIEDSLVDFAKTGKLNWRQFVADMAEELLRSQIRETLASLGQALGLGNLFGGAGKGSTPGSSASNPMYVVNVGSGGAAGTSGDPLGDFISKLGGGGRAPAVTSGGGIGGGGSTLDNILNIGKSILGGGGNLLSTIGSGIKNLFGGFFANGGRIPGGKFGVVGERGPEFIGGPANITPMAMGGSTNVTYNIQAVDAASFQALVARDPGFIHAVAEMGRSRLPGARR